MSFSEVIEEATELICHVLGHHYSLIKVLSTGNSKIEVFRKRLCAKVLTALTQRKPTKESNLRTNQLWVLKFKTLSDLNCERNITHFHVDSSSDLVAVKFLYLLDLFNPEQHIKRRHITVVTPLTSWSLFLGLHVTSPKIKLRIYRFFWVSTFTRYYST